MRYRRKIRVLPGLTLNLSKTGISTTVGLKGFNVNIGKNGAYLNTGIPGTGLYDREKIMPAPAVSDDTPSENERFASKGLSRLCDGLASVFERRKELLHDLVIVKRFLKLAVVLVIVSTVLKFYTSPSGIMSGKTFFFLCSCILFAGAIADRIAIAAKLKKECFAVKQNISDDVKKEFGVLERAFANLAQAGRIYYIKNTREINSIRERTQATRRLDTEQIVLAPRQGECRLLETDMAPIVFTMSGKGALYLYPAFILVQHGENSNPSVAMWQELTVSTKINRFLEEDVPNDIKVVGETWKYTNKDGSPDKRFKDNYPIKIVEYDSITFAFPGGAAYCYYVSSYEKAEAFASRFRKYRENLAGGNAGACDVC